jgi:hypothetical protein
MIGTAASILLALFLLLPSAPPAALAAPDTRHSGTIVAIDPQGGVMILEEIGPWGVDHGKTVVTRLTITLTALTKVNTFIRVNAPGAFAGDFIEVSLDVADVSPGDFATADCVHEHGRLIAPRVTVAESR